MTQIISEKYPALSSGGLSWKSQTNLESFQKYTTQKSQTHTLTDSQKGGEQLPRWERARQRMKKINQTDKWLRGDGEKHSIKKLNMKGLLGEW